MMSDNKIIALIQGISAQVSAQYESIGVQSQVFVDPNIFRSTLKDGTVIDIPIENFNNYSLADKAKVIKLITNGDGKAVLFNDGTYKAVDRINNDNVDFPLVASMWIQDATDTNKYTYTLNHKLNDENISCTVYNSNNKQETLGVQIIDNDNVKFESTSPIVGKVVINYSSSNSDRLSNTATIDSRYVFTTMTDADVYFEATKLALVYGLIISVGTADNEKIYKWTGENNPITYDGSNFIEQTYFIRGKQGLQGLKPAHYWTGTTLFTENQNGSYDDGVNLKGETGNAGTKLNVRGNYDPLIEYTVTPDSMDVVNYNGKAYACLQTNTGKQPDISTPDWSLLIDNVLTVNDWVLDTTSQYPTLRLKTPNGDLFYVAKNGDNNECTVFGDITRSTHIDSSTDIIVGKIDENTDLSFDINALSTEEQSTTLCSFDFIPPVEGFITQITMNLLNVQSNTQVKFIVTDKVNNNIIYQDNIQVSSDFINGISQDAYDLINGSQSITLNKIFALAYPNAHNLQFIFNKAVTIKGSTVNSVFIPETKLITKAISVETLATQEWAMKSGLQNVKDAMLPTGIKNGENSFDMSFDDTTRTFNLTLKSGVNSFTYYLYGTKVEISENKSIQIPDVTDVYFIYFDAYGDINYTTNYSIEDTSKLPLVFIRWNTTAQKSYSQWSMYPNIFIDGKMRTYMLQSTGTTVTDGFNITATIGGDGTSDVQYKFALDSGRFAVAERTFNINNVATPTNSYENILNPICNVSNFYRLGNTQGFIVDDVTDTPLKKGTNFPYYNIKDGSGNWILQEATTGKYIVSHILVNTSIKSNKNVFVIMGQGMSDDLDKAKSDLSYDKLDKGNLDVEACKVLYTLYFKVDATYTNSFKATLQYVEDLKNKSNIEVISTSVIKHNSLSGRADSNSHPSSAISFDEVSPISDSTTAIKIQNADKSKDLIVIDTLNGYINNKVPTVPCQLTTAQRLALPIATIPLYAETVDIDIGCSMRYIGGGIWIQI